MGSYQILYLQNPFDAYSISTIMKSITSLTDIWVKSLLILFLAGVLSSCKQEVDLYSQIENKIDSLLQIMTLEEKLGQLTVVAYSTQMVGPEGEAVDFNTGIRNGHIGGIQSIGGVEQLRKLQEIAVSESRLGIPLMFLFDIIHGRQVVFPIPLAEASSWDMEAIYLSSRIAAIEAAAEGITMNYAPVADVTRDPRWGRIMEGAGEDPYLTSRIVEARVKGYQGDDLSSPFTLLACVKHFAAYGAAEGGRDYNIVDISERRLREVYLPPFKAALDAGVGSLMVSFNEINGIPSSSNRYLLKDLLKEKWKFDGFVIADFTSIDELVNHGLARDQKEAAMLAMDAGLDVDLISQAYLNHIGTLIEEGRIRTAQVDDAVRRWLRMKYRLGIMDDPFRYLNQARSDSAVYRDEYQKIAREIARQSIVLLKNENKLLPLKKDLDKIALIGPFIDNRVDPRGEWAFGGSHYDEVVTMMEGIRNKVPDKTQLLYAKGCDSQNESTDGFREALRVAEEADVLIVGLGEPISMVGEAHSRVYLDLPGKQLDLLTELNKTGKPIVVVLLNGRPLLLDWLEHHIPAIVEAWHLGHQSGNAIADVLFGDYNPSGKLTVSFPVTEGQIPVYYSHKTTGRPFQEDLRWCTHYIDAPNDPLYPFGFGLSYTTFDYSDIRINRSEMGPSDTLTASISIRNTGDRDGEEVVQMYIRDMNASVTRPVKELKGFKKISLRAGEEKEVSFPITVDQLKFYDQQMNYISEPGEFKIYIGKSSKEVKEAAFFLTGTQGQ